LAAKPGAGEAAQMDLTFERGTADSPRGHALVYFRSSQDPAVVMASYLVIAPVPINLSRYMPPMFAANLPASELQSISAIPLPPLPEKVESYAWLQRMAEAREEDLVFAGTLEPDDVQRGLLLMSEVGQQYARLYADYLSRLPPAAVEEQEAEAPALGVHEVLYSLMSEKQRLSELAKLTGKLRYAVEGGDQRQIDEAVQEMEALANVVPEKYRVRALIAAARIPGPKGERLSQLYIDRCYRLSDEDYSGLQKIDEEIKALEAS